ncbi:MAG: hypothetical protein ACU0CI_00385 [Shimia sp.]
MDTGSLIVMSITLAFLGLPLLFGGDVDVVEEDTDDNAVDEGAEGETTASLGEMIDAANESPSDDTTDTEVGAPSAPTPEDTTAEEPSTPAENAGAAGEADPAQEETSPEPEPQSTEGDTGPTAPDDDAPASEDTLTAPAPSQPDPAEEDPEPTPSPATADPTEPTTEDDTPVEPATPNDAQSDEAPVPGSSDPETDPETSTGDEGALDGAGGTADTPEVQGPLTDRIDISEVGAADAPVENDGTDQLDNLPSDTLGVVSSSIIDTVEDFDPATERLTVDLSDIMGGDSIVSARLMEIPSLAVTDLVLVSEDDDGDLREGIIRIDATGLEPSDVELIGGDTGA